MGSYTRKRDLIEPSRSIKNLKTVTKLYVRDWPCPQPCLNIHIKYSRAEKWCPTLKMNVLAFYSKYKICIENVVGCVTLRTVVQNTWKKHTPGVQSLPNESTQVLTDEGFQWCFFQWCSSTVENKKVACRQHSSGLYDNMNYLRPLVVTAPTSI